MFKKIKVYTHDSYINAFVCYNNNYYIVSDDGYGCNIYTCDKHGKVTNWIEIARLDDVMLGSIVKNKTFFTACIGKKNLTALAPRVML